MTFSNSFRPMCGLRQRKILDDQVNERNDVAQGCQNHRVARQPLQSPDVLNFRRARKAWQTFALLRSQQV